MLKYKIPQIVTLIRYVDPGFIRTAGFKKKKTLIIYLTISVFGESR